MIKSTLLFLVITAVFTNAEIINSQDTYLAFTTERKCSHPVLSSRYDNKKSIILYKNGFYCQQSIEGDSQVGQSNKEIGIYEIKDSKLYMTPLHMKSYSLNTGFGISKYIENGVRKQGIIENNFLILNRNMVSERTGVKNIAIAHCYFPDTLKIDTSYNTDDSINHRMQSFISDIKYSRNREFKYVNPLNQYEKDSSAYKFRLEIEKILISRLESFTDDSLRSEIGPNCFRGVYDTESEKLLIDFNTIFKDGNVILKSIESVIRNNNLENDLPGLIMIEIIINDQIVVLK
ncbi:hypothetical protein CEQ90_20480 [Lewinellaceae bacterium SD302]|nr:hypothetical protein CEQ90_20480 [Lewinellaceae bacterium SD302]